MKKLKIFILLLFTSSLLQAQFPGSVFTGNSAPSGTYNKFSLQSCYFIDSLDHRWYYSPTAGVWNIATGLAAQGAAGATGATGATGAAGSNASVTIGTVTTLSPGSSATVTNSGTAQNAVWNFGIPRGAAGTGGGGGTAGWVEDVYTSPDKYGAIHANTTIAGAGHNQAYADSAWPGTGAVTTDNVDWAAWQAAINDAADNKKPVIAYGDYFINQSLQIEKYFESLTILGGYATIWTVNDDAFDVIGRPAPTNNSDANVMTNSIISISNLQINTLVPNITQFGIELGPSYFAVYESVNVSNMAEAIHLRFALNTTIRNCNSYGNNIGWTADIGDWTGADNSNSQSNVTTFDHCIATMNEGDYAFGVFAASGCRVYDCIVNGTQCKNGIDYNALGSVNVFSFWVQNFKVTCDFDSATGVSSLSSQSLTTGSKTFTVATGLTYPAGYPIRLLSAGHGYMEGTVTSYNSGSGALVVSITSVPSGSGGPFTNWKAVIMLACTNAAIKSRALGGILGVDGAQGTKACIMIDGEATLSNLNIHLENSFSWVPFPNGPSFSGGNTDKMFRSRTSAQAWDFEWNILGTTATSDYAGLFIDNNGMGGTAAAAVTLATLGTDGNGNSRYIVVPSPK